MSRVLAAGVVASQFEITDEGLQKCFDEFTSELSEFKRYLVRAGTNLRRQESRTEEECHATNTNIYHKSSLWHRKGLEG